MTFTCSLELKKGNNFPPIWWREKLFSINQTSKRGQKSFHFYTLQSSSCYSSKHFHKVLRVIALGRVCFSECNSSLTLTKNTLSYTFINPQLQQLGSRCCEHNFLSLSICSTPQKFHFSMFSWGGRSTFPAATFHTLWSSVLNHTALFHWVLGALP